MERILESVSFEDEKKWENELRPQQFSDFPGQEDIKDKLKVYIQAAKKRQEPLDHVLLFGPPGLGKTTLARIIANELGVDFKVASAPSIEKKGDLAGLLTSLKPYSVLFIDEIHRLNRTLEEYLYSAMEDYYIDIVTGDGIGARSMKFQLSPFTLVGATTRAGALNAPFRDRFGIVERLQFYDRKSLQQILSRNAGLLKMTVGEGGAEEIAGRSRGTPRIANRLLKRVRDFADVQGNGIVDAVLAEGALNRLGVDKLGLDMMDRKLLTLIYEKYNSGPVGIETLSAALSEDKDTLEDVFEPFLIQEGFVQKTPRGRILTDYAKKTLFSDTHT
ncbi:MAG: Holliday junction branch migration DNA helicase RuvB [Bdellovibrionaceae bacterium]|nr:Holliday junction branch migration DNA helicase RuvB [Pseudobdellovibrionaceae bacterium]